MQTFAAIDFETANQHRSSVCSVGVVIVRDGIVADEFYSLIHPTPDFYSYWNVRVHGITEADTRTAPLFPEVWDALFPRIEGLTLVAHNSTFDRSCLRAVLAAYAMPEPASPFLCTYQASRRLLPQLPDHKLGTVARYCGFDLTRHHHALADAQACAAIALKLLRDEA